jgi:hypothetical protein
LIILIILDEEHKSRSSWLCNILHSPHPSSVQTSSSAHCSQTPVINSLAFIKFIYGCWLLFLRLPISKNSRPLILSLCWMNKQLISSIHCPLLLYALRVKCS